MNIFWKILTLSLITTNIQADECKTELHKKDSYTDISVILNCLSTKIKNMEEDIKILKSSKEVVTPVGKETSVEINNCGPVKTDGLTAYIVPKMTGATVKANFNIVNTTSETVNLAWDLDNRPTLSDDTYALSGQSNEYNIKGIPYVKSTTSDHIDSYIKLSAGQKLGIGLEFGTGFKGSKSGQTNVNIAMTFFKYDINKGKAERIGLSPCAKMTVGD